MKQVLIFLLIVPFFLTAQSSGKIIYTQVQKLNITSRPGMSQESLNRIPKERKMIRELVFNAHESIYKKGKLEVPEESQLTAERMARRRNRMMRGRENGASYKNIDSGQMIDQRIIFGKEFLVKDELIKYEWKITGNKKQILDYLVMEAQTTIEDTILVTAWFTPQINIQNGPSRFGGLPGLILELDQDDGKNNIIATSIELGELNPEDLIKEPKKGKQVNREEFNNIRRKKREEMNDQIGSRVGRSRVRGN